MVSALSRSKGPICNGSGLEIRGSGMSVPGLGNFDGRRLGMVLQNP